MIRVSPKILREHQINILEWFLKDHMTMKTGVMMKKVQLYHHGYKWHFKLSSVIIIFQNMTVFTVWLINASLVSIRDINKIKIKNTLKYYQPQTFDLWCTLWTHLTKFVSHDLDSCNLFQNLKWVFGVKGILHPKTEILSSFTNPHVVANLYEFLTSDEHKARYFEERLKPSICV